MGGEREKKRRGRRRKMNEIEARKDDNLEKT